MSPKGIVQADKRAGATRQGGRQAIVAAIKNSA
jgi:hypothetical protein